MANKYDFYKPNPRIIHNLYFRFLISNCWWKNINWLLFISIKSLLWRIKKEIIRKEYFKRYWLFLFSFSILQNGSKSLYQDGFNLKSIIKLKANFINVYQKSSSLYVYFSKSWKYLYRIIIFNFNRFDDNIEIIKW